MPHKDSSSHTRKRGKDKQKDRYARYGKFTSKGLRAKEKLLEKQIADRKITNSSNS